MRSSSLIECRTWLMEPAEPRGFRFQEAVGELPLVDERHAVVAVGGCGICATDVGFFFGEVPTVTKPPLTLGHEVSGTVVDGAPALIGRDVILPTIIPCRSCTLCRSGRANACPQQKMLGRSYGKAGGFSSHVVVPASELCVIPADCPIARERLAVVADAVATPYQACRRARVGEGDNVIVIGATGGLGVYATQWARHFGAGLVVGVARSAEKLAVMRGYGLDVAIAFDGRDPDSVRRELWQACKTRGVNPRHSWKILEVSGSRGGLEVALHLLTYASTLVLVGYASEPVPYVFSRLMALNAAIEGSWACDPRLYPEVLAPIIAGAIQVVPFTELRPMSTIADAFAELRNARASLRRIVLVPDWPAEGRRQGC